MSMIKIFHILTDSNIGGAGHQLLTLLSKQNGLDRSQFDITVALPVNAKLKPAFEQQGIYCTELPHLAESSFSVRVVRVLLAEMKKLKPQIVHTHASLSGRIAARLYRKCKIVHTRHSYFEVADWRRMSILTRLVYGLFNNGLSDTIIAVSPAVKDNLIALGTSEKKIQVIFNGSPPVKKFDQGERAGLRVKYNIPQDAFVLAQVARLTEIKGQDYVLDAVKDMSNVIVLMAGIGDSRSHLEARIKNENINNVRLLGFVDATEELFAIADVQISASYGTEATSMALVQGMSAGIPAIATNYGGNPYVIKNKENGLLIPTRNAQALKLAIHLLQNDRALYAHTLERAIEIYNTQFTAEEMTAKTQQLYKELLHSEN